jgi:hypothetical protein
MFLAILVPAVALAAEPAPASPTNAQPPTYAPGYPPPPGYVPPGYAPAVAVSAPAPPAKRVGIGYKVGNGLGFIGGDILIAPVEHLVLDLQANYFSYSTSGSTASGYGLAPAVQGRLNAGQVSSPYLGAGYLYARLTLGNVTSSGSGFFVNAGYEWRWVSGLGIIVGGGLCRLSELTATDGITTIHRAGGFGPNIEAGLRYMFL